MSGVTLGSATVFLATRRYGRPYVERVVAIDTLTKWDEFVETTGVYGLFVLFLLPTFPDDVLCFVAGLSDLRLRTFLALVIVGRGTSFVAVAYAGTRLADGDGLTFALLVSALAVLSAIAYAGLDRLVASIEHLA
jgi:uncharacterized membrane protein YdjX (TVP38/TMEM64 family)